MKSKFTVLGLMSGSSVDGLDVCKVVFEEKNQQWHFKILEAITLPYSDYWIRKLTQSPKLSAKKVRFLDNEFGEWIAQSLLPYLNQVTLISFHGHTVFHQPKKKLSWQLGNPEMISYYTQRPVIADFRTADILWGGQGAPLVPFGEKMLFAEYDGFLNLGGICNLSGWKGQNGFAGDMAPFNQVFNALASKVNKPFDKNGRMAASGTCDSDYLEKLGVLPFFKKPFPKSLDNRLTSTILNILDSLSVEDALATYAQFVSTQIAQQINTFTFQKVLVSGGGVGNEFVLKLIEEKTQYPLIIPNQEIINFKEALIFAFLGLMRYQNKTNTIPTCTGASKPLSTGGIFTCGYSPQFP